MKLKMSISSAETASIVTLMSAVTKKTVTEDMLFPKLADTEKELQVGPLSIQSYKDEKGIYHSTIMYQETYILGLIMILLRYADPLHLMVDGCKKFIDGIASFAGIKKEIVSFTETFFKEE